jgi:hypothetical protein
LNFTPELLITALQDYLRTSITSSLAALTRALGSLPTLDKTLLEIAARCQNIVALEILLETIKPPPHPLLSRTTATTTTVSPSPPTITPPTNFLHPLLQNLETSSLPSHFWRSLGSGLVPRVAELVAKGGVQARTLKTNKNSVRDAIRDCVVKGSQPPGGAAGLAAGKTKKALQNGWEREVAVMVGAVVNQLTR